MNFSIHVTFFLLLVLAASAGRAEWYQEGQNKMGTRVFVKLWHNDESAAKQLLSSAMAEVDRIEASMSTFRKDSEISQINLNAASDWVTAGPELFSLLERALSLSAQTGGAFDITFDSVGQLYDFRQQRRPSTQQIEEYLPLIDFRHVLLNADTSSVRFTHPGVRINLGGIAKGYAVEMIVLLLMNAGVEHALANAGGDTRVLGDRVDGPWIVGVRDPDNELKFSARLELDNEAISTSGDYEQFFMEDNIRYHHILNPSTGGPADSVRSATIIGPDATMTDGLSTSIFILGPDAGIKLIESLPDYEAIIIDRQQRVHFSTGINMK